MAAKNLLSFPGAPSTDAPAHLSAEARELWHEITVQFRFGDRAGLLVLQAALEAFDRCQEARRIVAAEGLMIEDRFGQPQPHPAARIDKENRTAMVTALSKLGIHLEPVKKPGRPGGS